MSEEHRQAFGGCPACGNVWNWLEVDDVQQCPDGCIVATDGTVYSLCPVDHAADRADMAAALAVAEGRKP